MISPRHSTRLLHGGLAALLISVSAPAFATADETVKGVFTLPGATEEVVGELNVSETGPLTRKLEVTYTDKQTGASIESFDVELTQELHLLTVDDALSTLIHQHVEHATAEGVFQTELTFPKPGLYHIYADTVPTGHGQQVVRFDLAVGEDAQPVAPSERATPPQSTETSYGLLKSGDGDYTVLLDPSSLKAGEDSMVMLNVEKNGEPAGDLEPYLGVAAHAVFIGTQDLTYVHAHAMQESEEGGGHGGHGDHGSEHAAEPAAGGHEHMDMEMAPAEGHGGGHHGDHGAAPAAGPLSPEMMLYATPPAPGRYALWIEFIGGGEVQTVPFTVDVPPATN